MTELAAVNLRDRPHVAGERADVAELGYRTEVERLADFGDLRRRAVARFERLGLPTVRSEDWRYTNLAPLTKAAYPPAPGAAEGEPAFPAVPGLSLRLVNGRPLRRPDNLPQGLEVRAAGEEDNLLRPDDHALMALNAALMPEALVISVARGVVIDTPLVLDHETIAEDGQSVHPQIIVKLEEGAALSLVERFGGRDAAYWVNPVRRLEIGAGSHLRLATVIEEGPRAIHTGAITAELAGSGRYESWSLLTGGRTVRHETRVAFRGEGGEATLKGATLAAKGENFAVYTALDHAVPHCVSRQTFRSVVDKGGSTAFQGRILVREGAQKTDANQSSRNLLLDRAAEANTKPELEIYADDVKCGHGATVGELDEDALFYLESRGIDRATARAMLVQAFVSGVVEDAPVVADHLRDNIARWMAERESKL